MAASRRNPLIAHISMTVKKQGASRMQHEEWVSARRAAGAMRSGDLRVRWPHMVAMNLRDIWLRWSKRGRTFAQEEIVFCKDRGKSNPMGMILTSHLQKAGGHIRTCSQWGIRPTWFFRRKATVLDILDIITQPQAGRLQQTTRCRHRQATMAMVCLMVLQAMVTMSTQPEDERRKVGTSPGTIRGRTSEIRKCTTRTKSFAELALSMWPY